MVGLEFVWSLYQNSGPALQFVLILGVAYVWKHDIEPRLTDLEQTQENRSDRWSDQELNAQERAMLIDDAHERVDDIEAITSRLKTRVRGLEQAHAIEHENDVNGDYRADGGGD